MGDHREPPVRDRGDAALRQAVGHPRPPHHDAHRFGHLRRRFGRLRARADHAGADPRARAAGAGRRRADAACANHYRRRGAAARPSALPGAHIHHLHRVDGGRAAARRLHRRASALVVDLLAQPAALRARPADQLLRVAQAAAPRSSAPARRARRRAHGGGGDRADAGADLGLSLIHI